MFLFFVETTNHQYSRTIQEGMWKQQLWFQKEMGEWKPKTLNFGNPALEKLLLSKNPTTQTLNPKLSYLKAKPHLTFSNPPYKDQHDQKTRNTPNTQNFQATTRLPTCTASFKVCFLNPLYMANNVVNPHTLRMEPQRTCGGQKEVGLGEARVWAAPKVEGERRNLLCPSLI